MYQKVGSAAALGTAGSLPFTGVNVIWLLLAAFALIAAGAALLRIAPRFGRTLKAQNQEL